MDNASPPVFLVGAERSGTTLLRLMLDHHPLMSWLAEFEYVVDRVDAQPDVYRAWLGTQRIFLDAGFTVDPALDVAGLAHSFMGQHRARSPHTQIVGATVHRHFDRLLRFWPAARFIHLVRDPRDVAPSVIKMGWAGNVYVGVERWLHAETLWDRLQAHLSADQHITLHYETLIQHPEEGLTRLCRFLGVPYSSEMLAYPEATTYSTPQPEMVQKWRQLLSERDIQLIEARVGALLTARGYQPGGLPTLTVSPLRASLLRADSHLRKARFRLRRYGIGLWLAGLLVNRLPLPALQERIRRAMIAIDRRHLK